MPPSSVRRKIEQRMQTIKQACSDSQLANNNLLLNIYGTNYNGVKPRPTYEDLFKFVDYPYKVVGQNSHIYKILATLIYA